MTSSVTTPAGLKYSLSCTSNLENETTIADYRDAWAASFDFCTANAATGIPNAAEKAAETAAYGRSSPDGAKFLYTLCATMAGSYFEPGVSAAQAKEIAAALTLCPDHPRRAVLEAVASAGQALVRTPPDGSRR